MLIRPLPRQLFFKLALILSLIATASSCASKEIVRDPPGTHSTKRDPVNFGTLLGTLVLMPVAPAALLLFPLQPEKAELESPNRHFYATIAGGIIAQTYTRFNYSGALEYVNGHLYSEFRFENFDKDRVYFQTGRLGYLFRPAPELNGGIVAGYRFAQGEKTLESFEIGFPLAIQLFRGNFRLEPYYLLSTSGVRWQYRAQIEFLVPNTKLMTGLIFEAKPLRDQSPYSLISSVLFGVRF